MIAETISIPAPFAQYVSAALARLGYLFTDVKWTFDQDKFAVHVQFPETAHTIEMLRKEVFFQIYREKIYEDTLAIRQKIYEAI